MILALLSALGLTIVLEGLVVYALTRDSRWVVISVAGNLLTNPLLNGIRLLVSVPTSGLLLMELGVTLAEAVLYFLVFRPSVRRAIGVSALANAVSFLLGSFLLWLIWR